VKSDILPEYKGKTCREIVAGDGGLYVNYDDEVVFKPQGMPAKSILTDTTGNINNYCNGLVKKHDKVYAGVNNQLYQLSGGKAHLLIDSIPINTFFNYTADTGNVFWINSAGKGLFRYQLSEGKKKNISSYTYDSNTSGYPFVDAGGSLWITSYEGLVKAMPKIYEEHTPPKIAYSSKRINIISGVDSEVIVSDASGLHVIKNYTIKKILRPASYHDETSYGQDIVEGFAKDGRGFTWMITRKRKMLCWNGTTLLDFSSKLTPRSADYIRNLAANPQTNKVFVCDDSTLIWGDEKHFEPFIDSKGKSFTKTTTVLFTNNGIGIVNVFSKGVYFISRQNEIIKAPPALDIIDKGSYTYFFEDKEGWIWISNAGKGLVRFRINPDDYSVSNLTTLTTEHGLPSNRIVSMAFDSRGNHWVSCSNGIVVLKKSENNDHIWDTYRLGNDEGLSIRPPAAVISDHYDNVWLASIDQLLKIDAKKLVLQKKPPGVVIEKVLLDMKETDWSKFADTVQGYFQLPSFVTLAHNQNALGIEFSGVSLSNADYFEYSYKLEPLDTAWSIPSTNKSISLLKLLPGAYSLSVKARGIGTAWSEEKTFRFNIEPPFWDTWWFRLMVSLTAAALIIAIYRNRIKKIQLKADMQNEMLELEMKALKAQMNPHFIYNALNSVQSLIASNKKTEAIDYVGKFSRLLRNILDYSDNNEISLDQELHALSLYIQLDSLRLHLEPEYIIASDDDIIFENEKVPPLILQPFVENALWHGLSRKEGEKRLQISFSQEDDYLLCAIEDNGIGRENAASFKNEITTSKGIDITVKRLMDFNRSTEPPAVYTDLKDEMGNALGTRVVIRIKRHFA
jgi:ligand-binding sensor domain-containing protein